VAAPAYTHDLTTINEAEVVTAFAEPTDVDYDDGGTPACDADYPFLQNTLSVSQPCTKTGIAGILCNNGSGITIPTDGAFFIWYIFTAPNAMDSYANGGMRVIIGNSLSAFYAWYVGGNDVGRMPYGGWQNWAVNPTVASQDPSGSPTGVWQYIGVATKVTTAIGKGNPHAIDVLRYGRGEARFSGGESANYAVFSGFVALNDATSARWGLMQAAPGGYLWKGLMSLGKSNAGTSSRARASNVATIVTAAAHSLRVGDIVTVAGLGGTGYNVTAAVASVPTTTSFTYANSGDNESTTGDTGGTFGCVVDFRDSNKIIFIDDTRRVTSAFNKVEVKHASSRIDWTGISFICVGPSTSTSKGSFAAIADADINIDSCLFQDMDAFTFQGNSTILTSIFRRCGLVTQGGAVFNGCTFDAPSGAVALLSDDLNDIDNCDFVSDGTGHAIELTSAHAGTSKTLVNVNFSNYAASNGSTGNEAIKNNSGGAVTITIDGGTSPSVYDVGASTTTIVTSARTIKVVAQLADGTKINLARVLLKVSADASGGFPYDDTVTIVNSGTLATVTHNSHGMATNDKVQISGASLTANNGVFVIAWISANSYSYTMASDPGSSPSGTIKCNYVFLSGDTDSNGEISMSRAIGANQLVAGWARKSSGAPYYKQGALAGQVVTTGNLTLTAVLLPDA